MNAIKTLFVIRVISIGEGNNKTTLRGGPQYVSDPFKSWDAGWYGRLSGATKTYKTKAGAMRWLAGRAQASIVAEVEEDPREINRRARLERANYSGHLTSEALDAAVS